MNYLSPAPDTSARYYRDLVHGSRSGRAPVPCRCMCCCTSRWSKGAYGHGREQRSCGSGSLRHIRGQCRWPCLRKRGEEGLRDCASPDLMPSQRLRTRRLLCGPYHLPLLRNWCLPNGLRKHGYEPCVNRCLCELPWSPALYIPGLLGILSCEVCGAADDAGSRDETWRILSIHHNDNER
ncbi:hypothetical protein V8C35DRAFT_141058 [Trichoderma chlorosporum]